MKYFYTIVALFIFQHCSYSLRAQTDVTNNGGLYISNNTDTVFITGSLTNNATASLDNIGGNLYVKQNVVNNQSSMSAGGGNLWFTGNTLQTISGSAPFRTYNWIVNNASGVLLQNRIGVGNGTAGNLNFVNGVITSGTNLQDVFFYENSTYSGYTNTAHIIGYCSKRGASDFTFPIGNSLLKADVDISGLTSNTDFQCKYFGIGYGIYSTQAPLVNVFNQEYWTLDRTAGISAALITLKWNDSRKILNHSLPSDLRVAHFTGPNWVSEAGTGSSNATTGTITSILVNNFSPFTFASVTAALPLKLHRFNATLNTNCNVVINWLVEDETDVNKYEVEVSTNGITWSNVETITVFNPSILQKKYSLVDKNLLTSINKAYYRLKLIKHNNTHFFSDVKLVVSNCVANEVIVSPTVTKGIITISNPNYLSTGSSISIKIINSNGLLVKAYPIANKQLTKIDLYELPAGLYYIKVIQGFEEKIFKVVKQ